MYFSQHVIQSVPPILSILGAETKLLKAGGEGGGGPNLGHICK